MSELQTIGDVVKDLLRRQSQVSAFIEQQVMGVELGEWDMEKVARWFILHGQNAGRIGRLLRDERALSGEAADGLLDAIAKALDEISTEMGIEL